MIFVHGLLLTSKPSKELVCTRASGQGTTLPLCRPPTTSNWQTYSAFAAAVIGENCSTRWTSWTIADMYPLFSVRTTRRFALWKHSAFSAARCSNSCFVQFCNSSAACSGKANVTLDVQSRASVTKKILPLSSWTEPLGASMVIPFSWMITWFCNYLSTETLTERGLNTHPMSPVMASFCIVDIMRDLLNWFTLHSCYLMLMLPFILVYRILSCPLLFFFDRSCIVCYMFILSHLHIHLVLLCYLILFHPPLSYFIVQLILYYLILPYHLIIPCFIFNLSYPFVSSYF